MAARKVVNVEHGVAQPINIVESKATPLAVDTTNTRWNGPLQERTNSEIYNNKAPSSALNYTSNPTCIPTPTCIIPTSNPGPHPAESSRRLKRYSLAEEALVSTLQNRNPEASPQELQIRALQNATALLGAHAKDAQERAAKLRLLLTDREVDRATYEALQRERWMEEKRQLAADREVKVVRQHLASLSKPSVEKTVVPGKDPAADANAKHQANLARFFELSLTRAPISAHKPKLLHVDRAPRRRTICHVTPMRLRTASVVSAFSRPPKGHSRSVSLDGKRLSPTAPITLGRLVGLPNSTSLSVVTEDPATDQSNIHDFTHPRASDAPAAGPQTQPPTTPRLAAGVGRSPRDNLNRHFEGVATIYEPMQARSRDEILADWGTEDVAIPDYALNLMENLDEVLDDITLRSRLLSQSYHAMSAGTVRPSRSYSPSSPSRPTTPPRHRAFFSLDSPSRSRLKNTNISKRHSDGQPTLYAIAEGTLSRDSISGSGSDTLPPSQAIPLKSSSSFFFHDHEAPPGSRLRGRTSFAGPYHDSETSDLAPGVDGPVSLANKVKRKFSILRRK